MSARRRFSAVDAAMLQLVRLVLDDAWTARDAAVQLRERVSDETVLRRARAKVACALSERASSIAERAAATLDLALSLGHALPMTAPALVLADTPGSGSPQ